MLIEIFKNKNYTDSALVKIVMFRKNLIEKLQKYRASGEIEELDRIKILEFVKSHKDCFKRSLTSGHITGSCWLENFDGTKFLLTKHKKLGVWLQLGGHADGDNDIIRVSLKEAHEESGLKNIELVSADIFDLGVHLISPYKDVSAHFHYDIRFLLRASNSNEKISMSDESTDLNWFSDVPKGNPEEANRDMLRMIKKWRSFHKPALNY